MTELVIFSIMNGQVMENLNLGDLVGKPYGTHLHFNVSWMKLAFVKYVY